MGPDGLVDPQQLAAALRPDTLLVSVMAAKAVAVAQARSGS